MTKYTLYCKCTECGEEREFRADFTKRVGQLLCLYCQKCGEHSWHTVYHWKYNTIKM